jgi:hypothetical protein
MPSQLNSFQDREAGHGQKMPNSRPILFTLEQLVKEMIVRPVAGNNTTVHHRIVHFNDQKMENRKERSAAQTD